MQALYTVPLLSSETARWTTPLFCVASRSHPPGRSRPSVRLVLRVRLCTMPQARHALLRVLLELLVTSDPVTLT